MSQKSLNYFTFSFPWSDLRWLIFVQKIAYAALVVFMAWHAAKAVILLYLGDIVSFMVLAKCFVVPGDPSFNEVSA
jgi:hypothetical protein